MSSHGSIVRICFAVTAAGLLAAGPANAVRQAPPPPRLAAALASWTGTHPATGVLVWRLDSPEPVEVLAYKATMPRRPASTMKVVTAAAALLTLSPEFRFETRLYAGAQATQTGTRLTGPLYLKGYGDPTLATPAYAQRYLGGVGGSIGGLARPVRDLGVQTASGPLVVDETFLDSVRRVPSWPARYATESQPLSGMNVNQSYLGERRRKYVKSPPTAAGVQLRLAMRALGITHTGKVVTGRAPAEGRLLSTVTSPPLRVILRLMLPDSDNFIAEMLLKNIGAYGRGTGSTAAGAAHAAQLLEDRGLLTPGDRFEDGSGLGLSNRLSPQTLVGLLSAADAEQAWGAHLFAALPRGGEGTLRRRLRSPNVRDLVRAKTGYIRRTSTLAGIVDSVNGPRYAFAILMNDGPLTGARATQDAIVGLLAAGVADGV